MPSFRNLLKLSASVTFEDRGTLCADIGNLHAQKNPDDDPSLDTVKANIHTGWYVGGTPESKT